MAFQNDSPRDKVFLFWEFNELDVIADAPEIGISTDPVPTILTTGTDGILRVTLDSGQTNTGGAGFGQLHWDISNGITFETRVRLSAIGTAAERVFVGLTDVQEATPSEMPFSIATTVLTASADPDDAIGFFWEGDATNASWYPASQNNDALVIDGVTNVVASNRVGPVAAVWNTLKFEIAPGATHVEFSVDGTHMFTYDGTAAIDDVALMPILVGTEGTAGINLDFDYLYVEGKRSA